MGIIYICDDEQIWIDKLTTLISEIQNEKCKEYTVKSFRSGKDLLEVLAGEQETKLIVLLDIEIQSENGFHISKRINEIKKDILLIFVSTHEEYVFQSFEFEPFRFVRKKYYEMELKNALLAAVEKLSAEEKENRVLVLGEEGQVVRIKEIVSAELVARKLNIQTIDGKEFQVKKPLSAFEQEVDMNAFVKINSGCIINLMHIDKYTKNQIDMVNGKIFYVSRRKIKEVGERVMEYWRKHV